jgi:2-dehydro-3-deoxyphosphogluconate aldolase/(4S)-4-hydroxy-2-oxoglutarate aldolase
MREQVINSVLENKIIVILRGFARETLIPLAEAMYDGGIRLIEITFSADGKISDEAIAADIKLLADHFGNRMHIGAGTVLKESQVELVKAAGGKFIISPDTNPDIIKKTKELGLVSIPGSLTPTEAVIAHRAGADFVKLFPVGVLGYKYIKDISAPLSHIKFLAVGGVSDKNMKDYFAAGACGIGVGSAIVDKKLINSGEFGMITEMAKKYTSQI